MPWKGNDFQYDRDEAIAALTTGKYGEDHSQVMLDLVDTENGIRKHYADVLRAYAENVLIPDAGTTRGVLHAADLLDPYSGKADQTGPFARTHLTGDAGAEELRP